MPDKTCHYCGRLDDCRPYGEGGSWVCIKCVTTDPEIDRIAGANFLAQGDAAAAMSPYMVEVLGPNGPEPLTEELLAHLKELVENGAKVEFIRVEQEAGDE